MKNTKDIPALPEDAEEISYKEKCKEDQYETKTKTNNTWNLEYCPSPCEGNGDCTGGSFFHKMVFFKSNLLTVFNGFQVEPHALIIVPKLHLTTHANVEWV